MKETWKHTIMFLLLILPSSFLQVVLIKLFPYTGLGRVITIPVTIFLNSLIIILSIVLNKRKKGKNTLTVVVALIVTIGLTVGLYPQENPPPILVQSKEAVNAIQDFENITKEDLMTSGELNNPRYVVALYKFKEEILLQGTYQLYHRENVYFYNYSVNDLEEIPSKLIGYDKLIWWYLNLQNLKS